MRFIKQIFDFYINSSIHVALAVYCLAWLTLLKFNLPYDEDVLYFIFFASITGYNFVKYFGLAKFHHRSLASWLKIIQVFSFICFVAMCYYALRLNATTLLYIGGLGVVTFLYAIPLLPSKLLLDKHENLRSISGVKVYIIALVWACVTVFLPLINADYFIEADVIVVSLQRFVFVLVLMFPFEIRDLQYDSIKLSTIPQQIGVKLTKVIGVFLVGIFFLLEFFKDILPQNHIWASCIVSILLLLALLFAKKQQGDYYSAFFVESISIIWLVLILLT